LWFPSPLASFFSPWGLHFFPLDRGPEGTFGSQSLPVHLPFLPSRMRATFKPPVHRETRSLSRVWRLVGRHSALHLEEAPLPDPFFSKILQRPFLVSFVAISPPHPLDQCCIQGASLIVRFDPRKRWRYLLIPFSLTSAPEIDSILNLLLLSRSFFWTNLFPLWVPSVTTLEFFYCSFSLPRFSSLSVLTRT